MTYRGFKIESIVQDTAEFTHAMEFDGSGDPSPERRVEFVVSETVAGFHWQELGAAPVPAVAIEMVDRIIDVRAALANALDDA